MSELTILLTLGALVASTVSGFLGMAGGALLIGLMVVLGLDLMVAVPIHGVVQLCSNGTRVLAHIRHVNWRLFGWHVVPMLPMPWLGLWAAQSVDAAWVHGLLAATIIYAAWAPKWGLSQIDGRLAFAGAGILAGFLGIIVGASGPIIAPFFLRDEFDRHSLIATKALCQLFNHALKLVVFASVAFPYGAHVGLIVPMCAAVVVGTLAGKWILYRLDEKRFRVVYRFVLTALAIRLGFGP